MPQPRLNRGVVTGRVVGWRLINYHKVRESGSVKQKKTHFLLKLSNQFAVFCPSLSVTAHVLPPASCRTTLRYFCLSFPQKVFELIVQTLGFVPKSKEGRYVLVEAIRAGTRTIVQDTGDRKCRYDRGTLRDCSNRREPSSLYEAVQQVLHLVEPSLTALVRACGLRE